jgi:hypothetical protein
MGKAHVIMAIAALLALTICPVLCENYLYVKDIDMHLKEDGNAVFKMNYTLEFFTKFYVLAMGCKYIEPGLISLFSDFGNVTTISADPDSATLVAWGAGKYNSGYYLYESRPLGAKIARLTVIYPEGSLKTFYNTTSTPNVFCMAGGSSNESALVMA